MQEGLNIISRAQFAIFAFLYVRFKSVHTVIFVITLSSVNNLLSS